MERARRVTSIAHALTARGAARPEVVRFRRPSAGGHVQATGAFQRYLNRRDRPGRSRAARAAVPAREDARRLGRFARVCWASFRRESD